MPPTTINRIDQNQTQMLYIVPESVRGRLLCALVSHRRNLWMVVMPHPTDLVQWSTRHFQSATKQLVVSLRCLVRHYPFDKHLLYPLLPGAISPFWRKTNLNFISFASLPFDIDKCTSIWMPLVPSCTLFAMPVFNSVPFFLSIWQHPLRQSFWYFHTHCDLQWVLQD